MPCVSLRIAWHNDCVNFIVEQERLYVCVCGCCVCPIMHLTSAIRFQGGNCVLLSVYRDNPHTMFSLCRWCCCCCGYLSTLWPGEWWVLVHIQHYCAGGALLLVFAKLRRWFVVVLNGGDCVYFLCAVDGSIHPNRNDADANRDVYFNKYTYIYIYT